MDNKIVYEGQDCNMTADEVATLLVKLYADYRINGGWDDNDNYAKAIGTSIRMLVDCD